MEKKIEEMAAQIYVNEVSHASLSDVNDEYINILKTCADNSIIAAHVFWDVAKKDMFKVAK